MRTNRRATAWLLAAALLGPSCSDRDAPPAASESATAATAAPAADAAPKDEEPVPVPPPVRPAPGTFTLDWSDDHLSVAANEAPRLEVLVAVAEAADFELEIEQPDAVWQPLSALIRDESLTEALPTLLGDFTFRTEQTFDPESQTHRVSRVSVGALREDVADAAPAAEPSASDPRLQPTDWDHSEPLGKVLRDAIQAPLSETDPAALFWMLEDPDPVVRMRAAIAVEPEGEGLDRLRNLLANDPDPRVRAATTASLENAESYAAIKALVDALNDPDPDVVLEVIESLEFAGDETNVPDLVPFLKHEDPRIRAAAAEAIDFLE